MTEPPPSCIPPRRLHLVALGLGLALLAALLPLFGELTAVGPDWPPLLKPLQGFAASLYPWVILTAMAYMAVGTLLCLGLADGWGARIIVAIAALLAWADLVGLGLLLFYHHREPTIDRVLDQTAPYLRLVMFGAALLVLLWLQRQRGRSAPFSAVLAVLGGGAAMAASRILVLRPDLVPPNVLPPNFPRQDLLPFAGPLLAWALVGLWAIRCWPIQTGQEETWPDEERDEARRLRRVAGGLRLIADEVYLYLLLLLLGVGLVLGEKYKVQDKAYRPILFLMVLIALAGPVLGLLGRLPCFIAPSGARPRLLLVLSWLLLAAALWLRLFPQPFHEGPGRLLTAQLAAQGMQEPGLIDPGRWLPGKGPIQTVPSPTEIGEFTPAIIGEFTPPVALQALSILVLLFYLLRLAPHVQDSTAFKWAAFNLTTLGLLALPLLAVKTWWPREIPNISEGLSYVAVGITSATMLSCGLMVSRLRRSALRHARELTERKAQVLVRQGTAHYVAGDLKQAIAAFSAAIQLYPEEMTGRLNRGAAYLQQDEPQRAIEDFTAVLKTHPDAQDAYLNRALAYRQAGDLEHAIADLDQIVQRHPDHLQAHQERAALHLERKDYDRAIADCSRIIELEPAQSAAYRTRAEVYQARGDAARSKADLDAANQLDSDTGGGSGFPFG